MVLDQSNPGERELVVAGKTIDICNNRTLFTLEVKERTKGLDLEGCLKTLLKDALDIEGDALLEINRIVKWSKHQVTVGRNVSLLAFTDQSVAAGKKKQIT